MYCQVPAAPLRAEASHRSEMVSQLLYGEKAVATESRDGWLHIRCLHDNYCGWVDERQLCPVKDSLTEYHILPKTQYVEINGQRILLPAGSELPFETEPASPSPLSIAEQFLGAPYLWGGRTALGIDCSGLMQVVYKIHGINLPRDASQQVLVGESLGLEQARTGDFAFFANDKGQIVHVGMVADDDATTILHASGNVRRDRLDATGIFNATLNRYTHRISTLRRIL